MDLDFTNLSRDLFTKVPHFFFIPKDLFILEIDLLDKPFIANFDWFKNQL